MIRSKKQKDRTGVNNKLINYRIGDIILAGTQQDLLDKLDLRIDYAKKSCNFYLTKYQEFKEKIDIFRGSDGLNSKNIEEFYQDFLRPFKFYSNQYYLSSEELKQLNSTRYLIGKYQINQGEHITLSQVLSKHEIVQSKDTGEKLIITITNKEQRNYEKALAVVEAFNIHLLKLSALGNKNAIEESRGTIFEKYDNGLPHFDVRSWEIDSERRNIIRFYLGEMNLSDNEVKNIEKFLYAEESAAETYTLSILPVVNPEQHMEKSKMPRLIMKGQLPPHCP